MKYTVFVDSLYGNDSFSGHLDSPVKSLSTAYSMVYSGGVIVLQNGTGLSYGALAITKNTTIKSAHGSTPHVGTLTLTNAQGLFEGLTFDSMDTGISVDNPTFGSVMVRDCRFQNVLYPISLKKVQYLAVYRNHFYGYRIGVKLNIAQECCVSSNVFGDGSTIGCRAIEIGTIQRVDLWRNTVFGAAQVPDVVGNDINLRVVYQVLTAFDITNKRINLPGFAARATSGSFDVVINTINGASFQYGATFQYGVDYTVNYPGSIVSWAGLGMESLMQVGDYIRIMYSEGQDPGNGDAIRVNNVGDTNSRVDSNSIQGNVPNPIIGVFLTTPVKIRHNNFYGVDTPWKGDIPTAPTGPNFLTGMNPLYRNVTGGDFHLLSGSPNIDAGDPGRWKDIYAEMGVANIGGHYTASVTGTRTNVVPFDRDLDYDYFNRGVTGVVGTTGDIGALEFNQHETAMGNYVSEQGYDIAHPGTATGPYATVDRGFARAGSQDLHIDTLSVPYQAGETGVYALPSSGSRYGRYHSKNIVMSDSDLKIGQTTSDDIAYIYSSYPSYETGAVYVSMDWGAGETGTFDNPYRTVSDALSFSSSRNIFVLPGFYPSFKGETGVRLIGLEQTRTASLNAKFLTDFRYGSWTGPGFYTGIGTHFYISGSADIYSKFGFFPKADVKYTLFTGLGGFVGGITNTDNSVYMGLDTTNTLTLGYRTALAGETGVQSYEYYYAFTGSYSDVRTHIILNSNQFSVQVSNDLLSKTLTSTLGSNYTGLWNVFYRSETGSKEISDFYLLADGFTGGVTGSGSTMVKKDVFGIVGCTGLQYK